MKYLELEFAFRKKDEPTREILMAQLLQVGFDSFDESDQAMKAYIPEEKFHEDLLKSVSILNNFGPEEISIVRRPLAEINWNAEWEKEFQPISIGNECFIRATFHDPQPDYKYEIIIDPKMSFGTGHHQTTRLMAKMMLELELSSSKVLDMGCGTGILGLLASKMGAAYVTGIDIDEWAYNNSIENADRNNIKNFSVVLGDAGAIGSEKYDVVLANITRNILLEDIKTYVNALADKGYLILSGFYDADLPLIVEEAEKNRLKFVRSISEEKWTGALFMK